MTQVVFLKSKEQPLLLPCLKITYAKSLLVTLGSYNTDSLIKAYIALTFSPVAVGSSGLGLGFKHSLSLSVAKFCFDSASNCNTCTVFYFISLIVTIKLIIGHYVLTVLETTLERITNK